MRVSMIAAMRKHRALIPSSGDSPICRYKKADSGTITAERVSSTLAMEYAFWKFPSEISSG